MQHKYEIARLFSSSYTIAIDHWTHVYVRIYKDEFKVKHSFKTDELFHDCLKHEY